MNGRLSMNIIRRIIQLIVLLPYFGVVILTVEYEIPEWQAFIVLLVGGMIFGGWFMTAIDDWLEDRIEVWVNALKKPRPHQKKVGNLRKVPGTRLLRLVDFFFSPKDVEGVFKPAVADWRVEYYEARKQKRFLKARWINVRHTYRFLMAMGLSKALEAVEKLLKELIKAFK